MKKVLIYSIFLVLVLSLSVCAKSKKTKEVDVKSTEGVEVSSQAAKTVYKSKADDKDGHAKQKNRNKYLHYINKLDRANDNKRLKERDLEFLNQRLEIKKKQLGELSPDVSEKGENEK